MNASASPGTGSSATEMGGKGLLWIMDDVDHEINEYVDLPDDPELAFAILHQRKYEELTRIWESMDDSSFVDELKYVDTLIAFDEVHDLGIFAHYKNPPTSKNNFYGFFHEFRRQAEISSQKFKMEDARRRKTGAQNIIVLDATSRKAIHTLINAIKERLNELTLSENKRETLFGKLNAFADEVDRNRTRTEAFYSFAFDTARVVRSVGDEIKPLLQTIDRMAELIDKAKKIHDLLPPWTDRKKIEGPPKRLTSPAPDFDDEIPF